MNPKLKKKLMIDGVMAVVILILMIPAASGIFLHEWLGVVIGLALVIHMILNRQWVAGVTRKFFGPMNLELRLSYLMNFMLAAAMGLTLVSGILISQYLFTALNANDLYAWTIIHAISSRATLGVAIIHVLLHLKWIKSTLKAVLRHPAWQPIRNAVVRTSLGLFALGATYAVIQTSVISPVLSTAAATGTSGASGSSDTSSLAVAETPAQDTTLQDLEDGTSVIDALPAPATDTGTAVTDGQDATEVVSLSEFLSRFTCTACGRHCLLSAPKCGRSQPQIQQETAAYNELYNA